MCDHFFIFFILSCHMGNHTLSLGEVIEVNLVSFCNKSCVTSPIDGDCDDLLQSMYNHLVVINSVLNQMETDNNCSSDCHCDKAGAVCLVMTVWRV